jgi:glycosyl transferase family 87
MASLTASGVERIGVALVPSGIAAVLLYTLLSGLGVAGFPATCVSIALAFPGGLWLSSRLPHDLDGALRRHTLLAVLWAVVGVSAIAATARLATFMADETRPEHSMFPFDDFYVHHSCLSAHFQAARLHRAGVPNIYERTLYEGPQGEPKFLGSLVIDPFFYPPPLLLLARLGLAISEDFAAWRAVWFGLEGALVASTFLAVALWVGGAVGRRVGLLAPVVWLSLPTLVTLQFGNFHLVAITGSMLAMLALERGRHALGGGLLAALTLSKVFPAILVLLLLFQRRWRAAAWTAGFGALFLGISYVVLGDAPFHALVSYHMPRMSSGAALETLFVHPDVIACNHAVFGLVQKLSLLGVAGASQRTAAAASSVYSIVLIGLAAFAARGSAAVPASDRRLRSALVWLALLQLASLRSPFTPDTYALFAPLWILVLLLASVGWHGWRPVGLLVLILAANFLVPTVEIMPLPALLGITLVLQVLFIALCVWILGVPGRDRLFSSRANPASPTT